MAHAYGPRRGHLRGRRPAGALPCSIVLMPASSSIMSALVLSLSLTYNAYAHVTQTRTPRAVREPVQGGWLHAVGQTALNGALNGRPAGSSCCGEQFLGTASSASACPSSSAAAPMRCSTRSQHAKSARARGASPTSPTWRRRPSRSCRPLTRRVPSCAAGSAARRRSSGRVAVAEVREEEDIIGAELCGPE